MIIKEQLKVPNSAETDYDVVHSENLAEMVKFSDTTLADVLGNFEVGKAAHADFANSAEMAENDSAGNKIAEYYLPIDNAAMTGTPTAPTYTGTDTTVNQICTCDYFNGLVRKTAGEVDSDMTLVKLITSINKDPNFATTAAIALGEKQSTSPLLNSLAEGSFAADSILYSTDSDTFVATPISAFGKAILAAQNLEEFYSLAEIKPAYFFDECGNHWRTSGSPSVTSTNAAFDKALYCPSGSYIQSLEHLLLGGDDFSIGFWAYPLEEGTIFSIGNLRLDIVYGGQHIYLDGKSPCSLVGAKNRLIHYELNYRAGTLYFFVNGSLNAGAVTIPRQARQITFGGAACYISEFRLQDGVCLHTANFTPPSVPYSADEYTKSLLHFD